MLGLTRASNALLALFFAGVMSAPAIASEPASTERNDVPPKRVVSMNLCTDQLAMLVAAPGQLLSVSYLALDPRGSAMATEAQAYQINHGLAEEIYLMQPDLVIAGSFSTRATVNMLQRLGIPVVVMEPAYSLDDVGARLQDMGDVLGQTVRADDLIADFEARLAELRADVSARPTAALY